MDIVKDIYKPLIFSSTIIGVTPYTYKNGKVNISNRKLIPGAILVLGNVALTIIYFDTFSKFVSSDFAKAETIKFLGIFRDLGSTTFMVFNLAGSIITTKKIMYAIDKIAEVDLKLAEFDLESFMEEKGKSMRRKIIILLIVVNVFFNTFGEVISAMIRDENQVIYILVTMYPRLVIGNMSCSFFFVLILIETRFEMINRVISAKIDKSYQIRKYPNEFDFCDNVRDLVSIHKILVEIAKKVNSFYSIQALVSITIDFVLIIGDLHTSMYIIFFDLFYKHYKIVLEMTKNCITYIFDLFYLAKRAGDLCNEANRTKVLLLGIKIDIEKENERNMIISSVLKLMQNKLEITACQLFNIDNSLLFSICGAASSYLFIMLQLDIGNANADVKDIEPPFETTVPN